MSDTAAAVLAVAAVLCVGWAGYVLLCVSGGWIDAARDVAEGLAKSADDRAAKASASADALAKALVSSSRALASAWKHRVNVEWEVTDSPRAARERTPDPKPERTDKRMDPLARWLIENGPLEPTAESNLRGCYAIVVGVRDAPPARRAYAKTVVDGYGVPLPDAA